MVDIVDPATRSRMMAGIGGRNTKPERQVRKHLHARGLRYVLGGRNLIGKPDLVLPKWNVAIFVHGCFWHVHGCLLSKIPSNNQNFWQKKLLANAERDDIVALNLLAAGWRIAIIWECTLRGKQAEAELQDLFDKLTDWIRNPALPQVLELPIAPARKSFCELNLK